MLREELTASQQRESRKHLHPGRYKQDIWSFPFVSRMEIVFYEGVCARSGVGGDEGILKTAHKV